MQRIERMADRWAVKSDKWKVAEMGERWADWRAVKTTERLVGGRELRWVE